MTENAELVLGFYEGMAAGDHGAMAIFAPHVRFHMPEVLPHGGTIEGVEALGRYFGDVQSRWEDFRVELDDLVDGGYHELDVDLGAVTFCDVAGLNVLLRARAAAVAAGGRLGLLGSCPTLRMMLRALHLERAFDPIRWDGEPAGDQA
jgi:hypothetical protein